MVRSFVVLAFTLFVVVLSTFCVMAVGNGIDEKEAKLPTKCHVCKHLVREIRDELAESSKTNDVLQIGQPFQGGVKKIPYRQSETRLTEAIENACSNVLDYKVHKDKPDAIRYEKVESVTFKTLKSLKKRGVKVDLGFPDEMWDSPDAEVTRLKNRCEFMVEKYEDEISDWYWKYQHQNLTQWLCVERVLDPGEDDCLNETKAWEEVREKERKKKENEDKENKTAGNRKDNSEKRGKRKKGMGKTPKPRKDKSLREKSGDGPEDEDDFAKIQRHIREQAEEQAAGRHRGRNSDRFGPKRISTLSKRKRRKLRRRLLEAGEDDDSLRIWREMRKIRQNELSKDEIGYVRGPWQDDLGDRISEETMRDLHERQYEHLKNPEDLRRELELLGRDDMDNDGSRVREMRWSLLQDSEDKNDMKELRERLKDLEAFSVIFDTHSDDNKNADKRLHDDGHNNKNRHHEHYHDEF